MEKRQFFVTYHNISRKGFSDWSLNDKNVQNLSLKDGLNALAARLPLAYNGKKTERSCHETF